MKPIVHMVITPLFIVLAACSADDEYSVAHGGGSFEGNTKVVGQIADPSHASVPNGNMIIQNDQAKQVFLFAENQLRTAALHGDYSRVEAGSSQNPNLGEAYIQATHGKNITSKANKKITIEAIYGNDGTFTTMGNDSEIFVMTTPSGYRNTFKSPHIVFKAGTGNSIIESTPDTTRQDRLIPVDIYADTIDEGAIIKYAANIYTNNMPSCDAEISGYDSDALNSTRSTSLFHSTQLHIEDENSAIYTTYKIISPQNKKIGDLPYGIPCR